MGAPQTLPADFFDKQQAAPETLPADFFSNQQPQTSAPPEEAKISAIPPPVGVRDKAARWAENVMSDIKYGTDNTGVGTVLKKMGAHGVYNGQPEAVGDFMASLPLGLLRSYKGQAEVTQPGKTLQGVQDIVGGALQGATIPSAFVSPVAIPKAPEAALQVGEVLNKVPGAGRAFASTTRAGRAFRQVNQAIGDVPFTVTDRLSEAASAVQKESELGGGNVPQVVRKFVRMVTDPDRPPMTFEEARRFASNASGLSAGEWFNMLKNGNMRRLIGEFHGAMNDAVQATAEAGGQGSKFAGAMNEYRQAKQNLRAFQTAVGSAVLKYGYGKAHEIGALLLGGE